MRKLSQVRPQTSNYQFSGLLRQGARLFTLAFLAHIVDFGGSGSFTQVEAASTDKVTFQIFEIDESLVDIMWCGQSNEVILVQSAQGTIYRSRDRGESWKKLHSYMRQTGQSVLEDGQTDIGQVRKMLQSPVDDSLVVFTGTVGINWVTEDCGANLRALNSGKRIHELMFHPRQRNWALAAGWTSCADFGDGEPCEIYKELYATKDLGASWQYLKSYVFDFAWGYTGYSFELNDPTLAPTESRVFITHDPDLRGHQQTRERWKQSVHLYYSDDFFKTQAVALEAGNSIVMTNHYMFIAKAVSTEKIKVHVSRAKGGFLDFRQARMPQAHALTDHFTVMDTSEKSVFLYVSDHTLSQPVGNLFISDGMGNRFTHSVENIVKGQGAVDFETVESMDGTFIANRYDFKHGAEKPGEKLGGVSSRAPTEGEIEAAEGKMDRKMGRERPGASVDKKNAGRIALEGKGSKGLATHELVDFTAKIKTYMTHNKGADWQLIRAPDQDLRGKSTNCYLEDQCSLHLQMYSHNPNHYAPPYSQERAVGIVLAVGNIGQKLETDRDARKGTFLSRDGGLTWSEIAKIPLIYEIGDHGALLVAAPNAEATKQIRYSWNEGKTWQKMEVSDVPIYVDNIIIEPKSTSQQFVIYGAYDNTTEAADGDLADLTNQERGEDVMISVDFTGLHEPQCKGADSPGKDDSDFELWSPHDDGRHGSTDKCFLGQQVTYVRRKQDSECFNGEDFERQTMRQSCLCTQADYECDVNYMKNTGGTCDPLPELKADSGIAATGVDKELDCKAEGFYYTTQGYRKIPGDRCYGGVDLEPTKHACTGIALIGSLVNFRTVILGVILVAVLYYGWPILEAVLLMLPIADPKESIEAARQWTGGALEMVAGALTNPTLGDRPAPDLGYSCDVNSAPEAYLQGDDDDEDDSSDEEMAKPASDSDEKPKLSYDSDEKNDDEDVAIMSTGLEAAPTSSEPGSSDLLDLDSGSTGNESASAGATLIPKLAGPK